MKRPSRLRAARQIVAVAWDQQELLAVIASRLRGGFELLDTIAISLVDKDFPQASAELAAELKSRKVGTCDLLLGLPRSQVDILTLELPPAQAHELPELVRNEVTRQASDLPEDTIVDFQVLSEGEGPTRVEAAVLRPESMLSVQQVADAIGVKPRQIVIRSLAIASLFRRQVKKVPNQAVLLNLMAASADISVLTHGQIRFTRSVHFQSDEESTLDVTHLADEVRRTMFVAPRNEAEIAEEDESPVRNVYMFADLDRRTELVGNLASDLDMSVSLLDPLNHIEVRRGRRPKGSQHYAAPVGMIWDFIEEVACLDFANPKQPPPPARPGRKIAAYAIASVVALGIVGVTLKSDLDEMRDQAASLSDEVKGQKQILEKLQSKTIVIDAVSRWEQSDVPWLSELRNLSEQFPTAEEAVVQRMTMAPSAGNRGLISMTVRVREPEIVATLENQIRDDRHQVSSQRISQSSAEEGLAVQFETRVVVTPPTAPANASAGSQ